MKYKAGVVSLTLLTGAGCEKPASLRFLASQVLVARLAVAESSLIVNGVLSPRGAIS